MALRTFRWGRLHEWGESKSYECGEEWSPVEPPDFTSESVASDAPGWDAFGWMHDAGGLVTEPRRLTRLQGCSVLRASRGINRWHVVSPNGLICASDSYHDGRWIGPRIGESVGSLNLRDDEPIGFRVHSEAVLIGHLWAENYAHTLLETASRFWAYETNPELAELPLVWDLNTPWQREIAEWLCPGNANPLPANHVRFDALWVPSFYSQLGSSRASVRWLRRRFAAPSELGKRRIYVSRADATSRRVKNESDVLERLRPMGFECVTLAGMSVADQRDLFGSAGVVVMPHGAGAANMLFSGTGAKFVELLPRSYAHPMFGHIAKWSGHWYGRIVLDGDASNDMTCDLEVMSNALDAAGVV